MRGAAPAVGGRPDEETAPRPGVERGRDEDPSSSHELGPSAGARVLEVVDDDHEVDDRLRPEPGHRGRADMDDVTAPVRPERSPQ